MFLLSPSINLKVKTFVSSFLPSANQCFCCGPLRARGINYGDGPGRQCINPVMPPETNWVSVTFHCIPSHIHHRTWEGQFANGALPRKSPSRLLPMHVWESLSKPWHQFSVSPTNRTYFAGGSNRTWFYFHPHIYPTSWNTNSLFHCKNKIFSPGTGCFQYRYGPSSTKSPFENLS